MAQIRIHVLHCGKIGVAPNLPASAQWRWPAKADARRLKSGARIWLPVSAYLVEHRKGLFLVDAGLPRTVSPTGIEDRAAQLRMFGRGWYTLVHSVVEPGQSIGEQLAARGIRPQDLDYVLFSHLDPDHVAGISEVRGAKRLLVAEEEYFWSCRVNLRYTSRKLWMDEPPERFWYRVNHIGPESRSYDLFGDDSVHLVHIAGHTEGMFATQILTARHSTYCHRQMWRAEHIHRGCAPLHRHPRTSGLHPSLGTYRRQPRLGGGMG